MRHQRGAFTLIEVLISIALLGILLLALYSLLDTQRKSNKHLYNYLQKTSEKEKIATILYKDLLQSDSNITVSKGEFDRVCIEETKNSLYGLGVAKVCWLVSKDGDNLIRLEGNGYRLPLNYDSRVFGDIVLKNLEIFTVDYNKKGTVSVVLKEQNKAPYAFAVYGLYYPKVSKKRKNRKKLIKRDKPSSTQIHKNYIHKNR